MSEKIIRPCGPSRSSAPKPIRPSPVPTSSSVSPGRSRALASTVSRTGYRNPVRSFSRCPASPPNRVPSSHRCQRSGPSVMTGILPARPGHSHTGGGLLACPVLFAGAEPVRAGGVYAAAGGLEGVVQLVQMVGLGVAHEFGASRALR
jgi:hypothetical protein